MKIKKIDFQIKNFYLIDEEKIDSFMDLAGEAINFFKPGSFVKIFLRRNVKYQCFNNFQEKISRQMVMF